MADDQTTESLETVFSGASLLFLGFVLGGILTLATKVVVARLFSPDIYGTFSQGMAVLFTFVMVSMVGLNAGSSRFISYYREGEEEKALSAVPSSLLLVIPFSLVVFGLLFLLADPIASILFQDPRMAMVLQVFAVAGPFMAVTSIFIAGFRGFQRSKERVVLLDFVIPAGQIMGIVVLFLLGFEFFGATVGFASAFAVATAVAWLWYRKDFPLSIRENVLGELFGFSWPLMVSAVSTQIFLWAPFIVVGLFAESVEAGLLNTALPLASATKMFLSSVAFLFLPVMSELFAAEKFDEMREVYASATRWILNLSMPMLAFFVFFPEQSIGLVFGAKYLEAGTALAVLILGYFVNLATGPAGEMLISVGRVKREMWANVLKMALFFVFAYFLVPPLGFLGGSAAFAGAMAIGNLLRFMFVYRYVKLFYAANFLKPFAAAVPAVAVSLLLQEWIVIAIGSFVAVYGIVLLCLRPLEERDREMVDRLLEKTGMENPAVKSVVDFAYNG